ncbi:MAG: hypothetical protein ACRC6B_10600, partial [Fusobacteriaceae bacterium]
HDSTIDGTRNGYVLGLAMFISGIAFGVLDVTASTYFQKNIPENIRGKVVGTITGVVKLTMPLAFIISGEITDLYSPFGSVALGGGIILLSIIVFFRNFGWKEKEAKSISEVI